MKVTFFLGEFPVPSETFVINQINGLIEQGLDVDILALKKGSLSESNETIQRYQLLNRARFLLDETNEESKLQWLTKRSSQVVKALLTKRVIKALNFNRFGKMSKSLLLPAAASSLRTPVHSDVFIAHFGVFGVVANQLSNLNLLKGKIITIFHGADISVKSTLENFSNDYQRLFSDTSMVLPISELWQRKLIEMGCPREKVKVNRMGINVDQFSARDSSTELSNPISIITVARFMEKKGLFDAVSAVHYLKERGVPFNYKIVGGGELEHKLIEHIKTLDLVDDIELISFQPQEIIRNLLDCADIFLLPSITASNGDMEGIPVALMEAMAMGLITVSTIHSGIPELIENNVSGFLAPESSPTELGNILSKIANNQVNVSEVRLAAQNVIASKFNQKTLYKELSNIVAEVK